MSYSTVSPDSTSLVFDDTYGRISVLNLSSTAVNTFDFKTTPDETETGEDAMADQMGMLAQLMSGGGPGALGGRAGADTGGARVTPLGRTRGVGETGQPGPIGSSEKETSDRNEEADALKLSRARERSKLRRKRRAFRRESRSQFRRDWRLAHALPRGSSAQSPLSSSPRAFSFAGFEADATGRGGAPRARDMHHTRYGQPPNDGGFSDLFGAHLGRRRSGADF
jgi:hypothetical protein